MLANAGGVVVSYFEWVKNLTHIPFGLMERRHNEREHVVLARSIEQMTGKRMSTGDREAFFAERSEINLVRSGLAEMMHQAFIEVSNHSKLEASTTLRDAAFQIAIQRIAGAYKAIGL